MSAHNPTTEIIHAFINMKADITKYFTDKSLNAFANASLDACKGLSKEEIAERQDENVRVSALLHKFSKISMQTLAFFEQLDKNPIHAETEARIE